MTAPATDFEALGFNPAPGELGRVDDSAEQYRRVSEQLRSARDAIESIVNQTGVWEGEASEAFVRRVGDLPEYLGMATDSTSRAAQALSSWRDSLGDMQRNARELELDARRARNEAEAARDNPAFGLANETFPDPESLQAAQRALDQAAKQLDAAIDNLEAIVDAAERLKAQHDEVARRIAELVDRARELAPDEPGLFSKALDEIGEWAAEQYNDLLDITESVIQDVGDFIEDNANAIANVSDVIGDVSTMIGAAGDVLNCIPVVGQIADQALNSISGTLGAVALVGHVGAKAAGADVPWETIGIDAAGLATNWLPGGGIGMLAGQGGMELTSGGEASTIYDNFEQYWAPRDLRQGIQGAVLPGSVAFENAIRDGIEEDNAGQAERDRQRAEERVWQ